MFLNVYEFAIKQVLSFTTSLQGCEIFQRKVNWFGATEVKVAHLDISNFFLKSTFSYKSRVNLKVMVHNSFAYGERERESIQALLTKLHYK